MSASNTPRVSVCIPTHERPELLREAIESVRAGTEQAFEIIVSDDADSEPTRRVVEAFNDPRIRYLRFSGNGISANWSNAVRNAGAPYAFKLDDDDRIEPAFLKKTCDFLDAQPDVAIVFTGFSFHRPHQPAVEIVDRAYFAGGIVEGLRYGGDILLNRAYPTNQKTAGVFRKKSAEEVGCFDRVTVDVMFTIALAATGNVGYIPEPLFQYHCRSDEHEGMGERPLQMLLESVRNLFEIPAVQSKPEWMGMREAAIRTLVKGAAVRYVANAFFVEGWQGGWTMVRFVTGIERTESEMLALFLGGDALFRVLPRKVLPQIPRRLHRQRLDEANHVALDAGVNDTLTGCLHFFCWSIRLLCRVAEVVLQVSNLENNKLRLYSDATSTILGRLSLLLPISSFSRKSGELRRSIESRDGRSTAVHSTVLDSRIQTDTSTTALTSLIGGQSPEHRAGVCRCRMHIELGNHVERPINKGATCNFSCQ